MKSVFSVLLLLAAAVFVSGGCDNGSGGIKPDNPVTRVDNPGTLTAVEWTVVATPVYPVSGSDGLIHLAYEIKFANVTTSASTVRINSLEVIDPENDNSVISSVKNTAFDGTDITYKLRNYDVPISFGASNYSDLLGPGQFGVMYMNVTFENEEDIPRFLGHRVTMSLPDVQGSGSVTATGGYTEVGTGNAVVLSPPLKGDRWLNGDGCCEIIGPHRFVINTMDGKLRLSERFAIDFVQLDENGRLYTGDPTVLANWLFYGADIYSAAEGRVVGVLDGLPDQTPGQLPPDATAVTAGGNHVVVDIGGGKYAFYAHMIPGSITVKEGDFVQRGQHIGNLGNSGNTDAPHLHFHVMDSPAPLNSNGLPYVFDSWAYQGKLVGGSLEEINAGIMAGNPAEVDTTGNGGMRRNELPLTNDISGFE